MCAEPAYEVGTSSGSPTAPDDSGYHCRVRRRARKRWRAPSVLPLAVGSLLACGAQPEDEATSESSATEGVEDAPRDPEVDGEPVDDCAVETPGPRPRLVRLTHAQYERSVNELLPGIEQSPASEFIADPLFAGFDNNADALTVTARLARDYRRAAEALAAEAVATPSILHGAAPCVAAAGDELALDEHEAEACAVELIERFGRRVYRRPLSESQRAAYLEVYRRGPGLYEEGAAFAQGVRLVLETMLQSPRFLYRVELSTGPGGDLDGDVIALDGYEIATRLSFLLWNSTPDDELLDAAADGALAQPAEIEEHARRLLDDPRAREPVLDFHAQWLGFQRYEGLSKDAALYPEFAELSAGAMQEETRRFIEHVVFELEEGYAALMTAPISFVNAELAAIYGVTHVADPEEFVRVELDADERAGLLTQLGFLAAHAQPDASSPILRGVFVHRQILCNQLPAPPDDVELDPPMDAGVYETTRERVEAHTSAPYCASCHGVINPAGFAFEHFDAIGRYRAHEGAAPIDAAASVPVDGGELAFTDHVDFATQLAALEQARRCYLENWFRYAYAREPASADACTLDGLHARAEQRDYNVKELLVAFTQTRTFRFRARDE